MATKLPVRQCLGIDVSKDDLALSFMNLEQDNRTRILTSKKLSNNKTGFAKLSILLKKFRAAQDIPFCVVMEATGVYYEDLAYYLHEQEVKVCVVLPNKSKAFAKSLDYKSKTDSIDAKILAQMGLERNLSPWKPLSDKMLIVKRLCRERVALQNHKTSVKNQLHAMNHAHKSNTEAVKRAKTLVKFLEKQIKEVEQQIKAEVANDQALKLKVDNITTIKGVGFITAVTVISETNGFSLIKNKAQLVSYAGYDVVENSSGSSVKGKTRISKKGNSFLRRAMHFPALTSVKYVPELKAIYDRVFFNTRIKMKAVVAVQRKILVLIYTLFKYDSVYDPNYLEKAQQRSVSKNKAGHGVPA